MIQGGKLMFFLEQPKWKKVEYSRTQIINAGKIIKSTNPSLDDIKQATDIIDNWRAAHAYPLHVIYIYLRRLSASRNDIVVAERLKRLDSIINKLKRQPNMNLWGMQDLGGCRFIVPTNEDVYAYANKMRDSRIRHRHIKTCDYISDPKISGYRSLHMIFEYHSDTIGIYNKNMLIEVQFRTHLQHLWATAVETMGLFTNQAIKSGQGDADVTRFFVLVSALFAIKEGKSIVPNTINDKYELISEIESLNTKCNFLDILSAIRVAVNHQNDPNQIRQGYYILILNYVTRMLSIKHFKASQNEEANNMYSAIESTRAKSKTDAVLVRVSSFQALKMAYPNYFSDIGEFVNLLKSYLSI